MKLVDLTVLEAVAEKRVGSSPTPGTKFSDCDVIGSRSRLKICRRNGVPVRFWPVAPPNNDKININFAGFLGS